jgi:hypothetical protein
MNTVPVQQISKLSTQQIGRLGELLVMFELLSHGIESAPMTTDSGVDLVAYSPANGSAVTIQVKTNLKPKPAGGKGAAAIDWRVSHDCPAQWFALVDLASRKIWLFTKAEFSMVAQQATSGGSHLYIYTEPGSKAYAQNGDHKFVKHLFDRKVANLHKQVD